MSRVLLIVLMIYAPLAVLSGCIKAGSDNARLRADADLEPTRSQVTHDCFKQLGPAGPLKGDQYAAAIATKGVCIGKGIAVSDLTRTEKVSFAGPDGTMASSPLYADGDKVIVKAGSKTAHIGTIVTSDRGSEMKLEDGISFEATDDTITIDINWN